MKKLCSLVIRRSFLNADAAVILYEEESVMKEFPSLPSTATVLSNVLRAS
jgi:hypothetical protein